MKFLVEDIIPSGIQEEISSALSLFRELERHGVLGPHNLSSLLTVLEKIPRLDLATKVQDFQREQDSKQTGKRKNYIIIQLPLVMSTAYSTKPDF